MARPKAGTTFWDRVYGHTKREGDCLIFAGHRNENGYGRIFRNGKLVFVHREVWERDNGAIPAGMCICHRCDRPACVEPSHLFMGTQSDNVHDMRSKGRQRDKRGSEQPMAKLTESDIPDIRMLLGWGVSCVTLAREYGTSDGAIRHVKKGRRWTHA